MGGLLRHKKRPILLETAFHKTVEQLLAAPKIIQDSMVWRDGSHGDYAACDLRVIAPEAPQWKLRLSMTAHVRKLPRKCSFMLLFGERIYALDVNPARTHNNKAASVSVAKTHWTLWPCDVVEPDDRDLIHVQWFNEFLSRTNISFFGKYERPPYIAEQLEWDV